MTPRSADSKNLEKRRELWREKKHLNADKFRQRGYKRIAGWISPDAARALAAAQARHGTTISEEIEAAIMLNLKLRVRETQR